MRMTLIKDMHGLTYYGNVPETYGLPASQVEERLYDSTKYWPMLDEHILASLNDACGTLLDLGDVDYLDGRGCAKLLRWVESHARQLPPKLASFFDDLSDYACRAIRLGTGVVVEL